MAGRRIALVTVVVADYDEAIGFYTESSASGWSRTAIWAAASAGSSWRPRRDRPASCWPAPPMSEQRARIGDQTGGRVGFFLETDDFARDHAAMLAAGVAFEEEPREEPYGTVAVFRDLHGNLFDLIQPRHP
jgi:catechol 2,3-dioxygenase-like lactoylglutathione lyase family enzyme